MVIFFLALTLLNTSIYCCTPPLEKEGSPSLSTAILITTTTSSSPQQPLQFNPLLENTSQLSSSYFAKQKVTRAISPRRLARIEEEQRIALSHSYFEWPGNSARLFIGNPALHVWTSKITESVYP